MGNGGKMIWDSPDNTGEVSRLRRRVLRAEQALAAQQAEYREACELLAAGLEEKASEADTLKEKVDELESEQALMIQTQKVFFEQLREMRQALSLGEFTESEIARLSGMVNDDRQR